MYFITHTGTVDSSLELLLMEVWNKEITRAHCPKYECIHDTSILITNPKICFIKLLF